MSKAIINNAEYLRALHKLKSKDRMALLKNADCICECVYNILHGTVLFSRKQQVALARCKNILRKLTKPGCDWKTKKRVLVQSGGAFLPFLLTPLLTGILSSLFEN